ncbi:long-chain fatty acid transport protein 2-like isoform 2-T2 [Liasis olivaceus]
MPDFYTILLGVLILLPLLANIFFPYLWLDLGFFFSSLWKGYKYQKCMQRSTPFTLLDVFLAKVLKHPEKPLILFEEEIYSYRDIDRRSNQMARVLKDHMRLKEGETVAVFLKNIPAYIWVWMGLEKIGCAMACINYNIRLKSLLHALRSCSAKVLLTTPGATCVLGPKFSVSNFWNNCRRYNVSVIQYVGETMRYLCNAPKKDNDCDHSVRLAIGNGMRKEVWKEFLSRFGCLKIYEFYGATEGNIGFVNYTGKVGAVGRTHFFHKKLAKFELIQYDIDQDEVVRNENGYCLPVAPGETGLLVSKITVTTPFHGYAGDPQKTKKKILQDVLEKGDRYFNSGDLLMQDHDGFIYFRDRVGDTFRWKGENVATTEVETILAMLEFIQEVNVYGVPVPGHEGKIGMAAIQLKEGESFDGKQLYAHTKNYLPNYAIPHFVRIRETLEITGTFKLCKKQLVREEFDPITIREPLFFLDNSEKSYVPLTPEIYCSITEKKLKL